MAARPTGVDSHDSRLTWFHAASIFPLCLVAFFMIGLVDYFMFWPHRDDAQDSAALGVEALLNFGHAVTLGLVIALVLLLFTGVFRGTAPRFTAACAALVAAGVWWTCGHAFLADLGLLDAQRPAALDILVLGAAGLLVLLGLYLAVLRLLLARSSRDDGASPLLAVVHVGVTALLLWSGTRLGDSAHLESRLLVLVGSGLGALLFTTEFFVYLEDRVPRRGLVIAIVTLVVGAGAAGSLVFARQADTFATARGALQAEHRAVGGTLLCLFEMASKTISGGHEHDDDHPPALDPIERERIDAISAAIADLEDDDRSDDLAALARLGAQFFDAHLRLRPETTSLVSEDEQRRLNDLLIRISSDETREPRSREAAFRFLTQLPNSELESFMRRCLDGPETAQRGAAAWFAARGDDVGRGVLLASLETEPAGWSLQIAADLAAMGERVALPYLLASLEHDDGDTVARALRGLQTIGQNDLALHLRALMTTDAVGIRSLAARTAMIELLETLRGPDADLILARLANVTDSEVAEPARAQLEERQPSSRVKDLLQIASTDENGDRRRIARDDEAALKHYENAEAAARLIGIEDPFLRYKIARTKAALGRTDEALEIVEELHRRRLPGLELRAVVTDLRRGLANPEVIEGGPDHADLDVRVVEAAFEEPLRGGASFARRVRIENKGKLPILGGPSPRALRLQWRFRTPGDETASPSREAAAFGRFLPASGLAPGEVVEIITLGRAPETPGRYEAQLHLVRDEIEKDADAILFRSTAVEVW